MTSNEIVGKLWNQCNVLRDDGVAYGDYLTELTYILFLKMMKERKQEDRIPAPYRWDRLVEKQGIELKNFYRQLLLDLGKEKIEVDGEEVKINLHVRQIYRNAQTAINKPAHLASIIEAIDRLDWFSADKDDFGDLYEGLLEKNAGETKSGAGQYFTNRQLIDVMVELVDPQPGERCNDPACGTFGFMIAVDKYLKGKTDEYFAVGVDAKFQREKALSGVELVGETHRLALMNALLHDLDSEIILGDSLSELGKGLKGFDVVLANPPFGTKQGGERPTRDDLTYKSSNKQLNFLQHIYRSLKSDGKARAAVVLPDNVLFQDGDGQNVRRDLMEKCNLHTILRLPTGIFYAQGVKTNVLFFTRGKSDEGNTKAVWFYDMRNDMPSFGKRTPLTKKHFEGFIAAYTAEDRNAVEDERWGVLSREEIREKGDSLDLGLMNDSTLDGRNDDVDPKELAEQAIEDLQAAINDLEAMLKLV